MSRKVTRIPVTLDPQGITELADEAIRIILRAANELIFSAGRGLLAKVLKGSRQKAVLEHDLISRRHTGTEQAFAGRNHRANRLDDPQWLFPHRI